MEKIPKTKLFRWQSSPEERTETRIGNALVYALTQCIRCEINSAKIRYRIFHVTQNHAVANS